MRRRSLAALTALTALLLAACGGQGAPEVETTAPVSIDLMSPAFERRASIPTRHTCDGEDVAPALRWSGVPDGAATLALVVDDPDAPGGTFVHWMLAGLPAVSEGVGDGRDRPGVEGTNGFGSVGYRGPCPPEGDEPHRYTFTLYAVDRPVDLEEGFSPADLEAALEGHVLARGRLVGTYGR